MTDTINNQLGFDALLSDADQDNSSRIFERETAHLPGTMEEGIAHYRGLIENHHAAMLVADVDTASGSATSATTPWPR